jgi:cytochrome c oxidase subunit 2
VTPALQRRLLLLGAAAGALNLLAPVAARRRQDRLIQVRARRFVFDPDKIPLRRGEAVILEFISLDVPMGFNAPDFEVRSDILPGVTTRLRFTPDKVGEFPFHCDIFCGSGHETMAGTLVVN